MTSEASYPVEVLLNNRLEKEIQNVVYPFNLLLTVTFASKYHIRDNYITPSYKIFDVPKVFAVFYALVVTSYKVFISLHLRLSYNSITTFFSFYIPLSRVTAFLVCYVLNVINCQNNVRLVVTIQMIYKSVDFNT
ncbi:hypothetical protein B5X24_HaOG200737 [Helicoverpa armigera]|uniref:Uncharacterized protein n=1 Tax=Helicoverpa armigera TaxID=29058 RepID=A0A2W1BV66_HELAM|nr:hypothetical protein B5X24_HaOG200737 [Helicoverpa armigera]